jgi:hypothetical protein
MALKHRPYRRLQSSGHVHDYDRQEMNNVFWWEFLFEISRRRWEGPLGASQRIMLWNSKIDGCVLGWSQMAGFDNNGTISWGYNASNIVSHYSSCKYK